MDQINEGRRKQKVTFNTWHYCADQILIELVMKANAQKLPQTATSTASRYFSLKRMKKKERKERWYCQPSILSLHSLREFSAWRISCTYFMFKKKFPRIRYKNGVCRMTILSLSLLGSFFIRKKQKQEKCFFFPLDVVFHEKIQKKTKHIKCGNITYKFLMQLFFSKSKYKHKHINHIYWQLPHTHIHTQNSQQKMSSRRASPKLFLAI